MSKPRDDSADTAALLAIGGVLLAIAGAALALAQWPHDSGVDHDGNVVVWVVGLLLGGLGQLMLLVAAIAWGVRLGIGWSGLLDPPAAARAPLTYRDEDGR